MINIHSRLLGLVTDSEYWLLSHMACGINLKTREVILRNKTLEEKTGYGRDKIRKLKESLSQKGIIEIYERVRPDGGSACNGYFISTDYIGIFVGHRELVELYEWNDKGAYKKQFVKPKKKRGGSEKPTGGGSENKTPGGAENKTPYISSISSSSSSIGLETFKGCCNNDAMFDSFLDLQKSPVEVVERIATEAIEHGLKEDDLGDFLNSMNGRHFAIRPKSKINGLDKLVKNYRDALRVH